MKHRYSKPLFFRRENDRTWHAHESRILELLSHGPRQPLPSPPRAARLNLSSREISNNNRILIQKIIYQSSRAPAPSQAPAHRSPRSRASPQIERENERLFVRIGQVQSGYSLKSLAPHRVATETFQSICAKFPRSKAGLVRNVNSRGKVIHVRPRIRPFEPCIKVMGDGREFHVTKQSRNGLARFIVFPCRKTGERFLLEFEEEQLFQLLIKHFGCDEMAMIEAMRFNSQNQLVIDTGVGPRAKGQYSSLRLVNDLEQQEEGLECERSERQKVRRKEVRSSLMIQRLQSMKMKQSGEGAGEMISKLSKHIDNLVYSTNKRKTKQDDDSSDSGLSDLNFDGSARESLLNDTKPFDRDP